MVLTDLFYMTAELVLDWNWLITAGGAVGAAGIMNFVGTKLPKKKNYGVKETVKPAASDEMWLREELLKSIWHAFRALDLDQRGKVSKSQLKVRSETSIF